MAAIDDVELREELIKSRVSRIITPENLNRLRDWYCLVIAVGRNEAEDDDLADDLDSLLELSQPTEEIV